MVNILFYGAALLLVLIFWSLFPMLVKYKISKKNVNVTILDFSWGVFIGAFFPSTIFVGDLLSQTTIGSLLTISVIGMLNFVGVVSMFTAYSRGKLGIVAPISNAGQSIMIAVFSSLLYFFSLLYKSLIAGVILMSGIILMSYGRKNEKASNRASIYFSVIAAVSWTFMWLLFYTLPRQQSPIVYYWALSGVSLAAALVYSHLNKNKNTTKIRHMSRSTLFAGILNGSATAVFAYAYTINPVLSPLVITLVSPIIVIMSLIFLKEKFSAKEAIGILVVIAALLIFNFI